MSAIAKSVRHTSTDDNKRTIRPIRVPEKHSYGFNFLRGEGWKNVHRTDPWSALSPPVPFSHLRPVTTNTASKILLSCFIFTNNWLTMTIKSRHKTRWGHTTHTHTNITQQSKINHLHLETFKRIKTKLIHSILHVCFTYLLLFR